MISKAISIVLAGSFLWSCTKEAPKQTELTKEFSQEALTKFAQPNDEYFSANDELSKLDYKSYIRIPSGDYFYFIEKDIKDTIKSYIRDQGEPWERHVTKYINDHAQEGSSVLDIGAHIGIHSIGMAKAVGATGTVHSFEPVAKLFIELNSNLHLNGVSNAKTYRFAVGGPNDPEMIEMNSMPSDNEGGVSVGTGGNKAKLVTIDSLNIQNVSLAKIDVEGFENNVLEGMVNTLKKYHPVLLLEISKDYKKTSAFLKKLGYKLEPISKQRDYIAIPDKNLSKSS